MKISELPLAQSVSTSDDVPIDRSGVTYRVKYEALRGPQGVPGEDGTIENLSVASTTLPPGSDPTVGYANNTITFGLSTGATGAAGIGVPSGGTTGQVLKKKSGTDYDTEWANESGGGGGSVAWGSITGTLSDQTDLQNALNAKQATLTFDTTPTASSTNPVTSGGVKAALDLKASAADVSALTQVSNDEYTGYGLTISATRIGPVVTVSVIAGTFSQSIAVDTYLCYLDTKYFPSSSYNLLTELGRITIGVTNGGIVTRFSASSGTGLRFTAVYLAKDAVPTT